MRTLQVLRRNWLSLLVGGLSLICLLGPVTVGAQSAPTPTPNVSTVPPINLLLTATPTLPPVRVPIVTATAVAAPNPDDNSGDNSSDGSNNGEANNGEDNESGNEPGEGSPSGDDPVIPNTNESSTLVEQSTAIDRSSDLSNNGAQLTLSMLPNRAFAWQGQALQLTLTLQNIGDQPATAVALQSDLPSLLAIQSIAVDDKSGAVQQVATATTAQQLNITWPRLEAGATVTVVLTLVIVPSTPNGILIDTFAVAHAQEVPAAIAGITIAMPPAHLPNFY